MGTNIIDITERLKSKSNNSTTNTESTEVADISEKRKELIEQDRRTVKRTILTEFISLHAVVPGYGLLKVNLADINDRGVAFDIDMNKGQYNIGDEVEMRIYLNHQTYFKIESKVAHVTQLVDEGIVRHGCVFVKDSVNNEALSHFVSFIESVTANLKKDKGDVLVSKINS